MKKTSLMWLGLAGLLAFACKSSRSSEAPSTTVHDRQVTQKSSASGQIKLLLQDVEKQSKRIAALQQHLNHTNDLNPQKKGALEVKLNEAALAATQAAQELSTLQQQDNKDKDKDKIRKLNKEVDTLDKEIAGISAQASVSEAQSALTPAQQQKLRQDEKAAEGSNTSAITLKARFFRGGLGAYSDDNNYIISFLGSAPIIPKEILFRNFDITLKDNLDTFSDKGATFALQTKVALEFESGGKTYCGIVEMNEKDLDDKTTDEIYSQIDENDEEHLVLDINKTDKIMHQAKVQEGECDAD